MFQKIWRDPVWSKVIAAGIIFLIPFIYTIIISAATQISFKEAVLSVLNLRIKVTYLIAGIFLFVIFWAIFKKWNELNKTKTKYTNEQIQIMNNNKLHDIEKGIQYEWRVTFLDGIPVPVRFTLFCTKHKDVNLPFEQNSRCPLATCENHDIITFAHVEIEKVKTILLNHWIEINNKNRIKN